MKAARLLPVGALLVAMMSIQYGATLTKTGNPFN